MEIHPYKPCVVVIGLMILTSLALALTVDVRITDEAGVELTLPDRVGPWEGAEVLYCQNPDCEREVLAAGLADRNVCPTCGAALHPMSLAERNMLPPDTLLVRKKYVDPEGRVILVAIVLSGKERASIHRPQVCLVGQGNEIVRSRTVPVPLPGRRPLDVMVLDLLGHGRLPDGRRLQVNRYYAYWFVGKGRETPYHVQRMFWMAFDRVVHNVAHRWAYISVSGTRPPEGEEHLAEIREFVGKLYPHIVRPTG